MDAKVRKLITCEKIYHPSADIECLYAKRENSLFNGISTFAGYSMPTLYF